jgi:hypothetical protein
LSGKFSRDDIQFLLNRFAEIVTDNKQIKFLDDERQKEFEKELSHLKEILPTYKKLAKPDDWKKSKEALKKLEEYQSEQKKIENRISVLEKILSSDQTS